MKALLITLATFYFSAVVGQQVTTGNKNFHVSEMVFDKDFIKLYKIKTISTENSIKQDGRPLKNGRNYYEWEFDRDGQVVLEVKTIPNLIRQSYDTITIKKEYDRQGNLFSVYEYFGGNVKIATYTYNEAGEQQKADIMEQVQRGGKAEFENRVDSFAYQVVSDSVKIKKTYNQEGATYREQEIKYDDQERLKETNGRYLRGYIRTKEEYVYNDAGLVAEKILYTDVDKNQYEKYEFQYDGIGNINRILSYVGDNKKKQIDFVYFQNSIILEAIIDQDIESHDLNILKFEYEYYDRFSSTRK